MAHIVGAFVIEPDGAGFKSHTPFNIVQSDDEWAAPIMAEVGPDGNLWILDWYNFIVQHNPTPAGFKTGKGNAYESDLRDKRHGRIYRLVYVGKDKEGKAAGTTASTTMNLADAKPEQLIAALKSDNRFWRMQAQRLLVERGDMTVVPALLKLLQDRDAEPMAIVAAVQTIAGLNEFLRNLGSDMSAAPFMALKNHPAESVRVAALRTLPKAAGSLDPTQITGSELQVELARMLAMSEMTLGNDALVKFINKTAVDANTLEDRWLREAFTCLAAKYPEAFFAIGNADRAKLSASTMNRLLPLATLVSEHVARGKTDVEGTRSLLKTLSSVQKEFRTAMLTGLDKGWPKNEPLELTADDEKLLAGLLKQISTEEQGTMVRWATKLGSKEMKSHLEGLASGWSKTVVDPKAPTAQRLSAAKDLVSLLSNDDATVTQLAAQLAPQAAPELVNGLLDALSSSTATNLAPELLAAANKLSPASKNAALRVLLKRPATTDALLDAIEAGKLAASDLQLDQRSALAAHPDRKIAARAKKLLAASGGLPNADREVVIKQYHAASDTKGDAAAGKLLFKANCAKCHKHGGEGENIGPDLTGMNVHPKHELLTQILDPSRSVESNFRIYQVETTDGLVRTGLLAAESQTTIELVDTEAKRIAIRRDEIENLAAGTKSLMPEGFEKQLTVQQMTDLLEFLAQRGKFVPLPLAKAATIVSTRGMFHDESNLGESIDLGDWKPRVIEGIPFTFVDPAGGKVNNVVLLNGPHGKLPPTMPRSATVPCAGPAKAIHLLSGVSGWGHPGGRVGDVSLIVRLHYADGQTEDHELKNGVHMADYIRRVDVPESKFAVDARGKQLRLVTVKPKRGEPIKEIEFVKGRDQTAPLVMAVTAESP